MAGVVPEPVGSVTAPAAAQEDPASRKRSEAVLHAGEHIKHVSEGWKEDGIGVLMFAGVFSAIVTSFVLDGYKHLFPTGSSGNPIACQAVPPAKGCSPPPPTAAIICVNALWLMSLVLGVTSALFATLTLNWARGYNRLSPNPGAGASRAHGHMRPMSFLGVLGHWHGTHNAVAMTVMLLHVAVFLFLAGLAIFFFTIYIPLGIVVTATVGLVGTVYLALTVLAYFDRNWPYRTPLSSAWWSRSQRGGLAGK
ncbi:hypothetical protein BC826DRAFT_915862 [Russula brevipes]|nr:hypothetical protein BC826DRAFT_915862 [Russula brevipes]